jgi:hypothetical protein
MFHIACTRFNIDTYNENMRYRNRHKEPVIYGSSLKIRDTYSPGVPIFVAEMNNATNKIEGIGLIRNNLCTDKHYFIYDNDDYNRYVYKGAYWISRENIVEINSLIVDIFDAILFKGKSHLKRKTGITIISPHLMAHWNYTLEILKSLVKNLFLHKFYQDRRALIEEVKEEEEEYIPKK